MTTTALLSQVRRSAQATRRAVGRSKRTLNTPFRPSTRRPKAVR